MSSTPLGRATRCASRLRWDPALVETVVEEILRMEMPTQGLLCMTTCDVDLGEAITPVLVSSSPAERCRSLSMLLERLSNLRLALGDAFDLLELVFARGIARLELEWGVT